MMYPQFRTLDGSTPSQLKNLTDYNGDVDSANLDLVVLEVEQHLKSQTVEDINALGFHLYHDFFSDEDESEDNSEDNSPDEMYFSDDVIEMLKTFNTESQLDFINVVNYIYDFLSDVKGSMEAYASHNSAQVNEDNSNDLPNSPIISLFEKVSGRMSKKSMNKKKRLFVAKSVAQLRQERSGRRLKNRLNRTKRVRYAKANKRKLSKYAKSRASAIKSGKHNVKLRHKS